MLLSSSFMLSYGAKVDQPAIFQRVFCCSLEQPIVDAHVSANTGSADAIYSRNWIKRSEKVPLSSKALGITMRLSALIEIVASKISVN